MRVLIVTPAVAAHWLKTAWPNRRLDAERVELFRRLMEAGQWRADSVIWFTGPRGTERLSDGQHRLNALVQHGRPLPFKVAGLEI